MSGRQAHQRLTPEKNLDLLLRVFDALQAVTADCRLLLVGDGPPRSALQARCPQTVFADNRSGDDLAALYASADAFVFPSVTETYGNVTPEAMASGLPVVAFDYAAAGRLIRHGDIGLLAPLHDDGAIVAQAVALAGRADRGGGLGRAARQTALAHTWQGVVHQIESLMRAAVDQRASPQRSALPLQLVDPGAR